MIVSMNLKTREQTIIEPINDADREVFKKNMDSALLQSRKTDERGIAM